MWDYFLQFINENQDTLSWLFDALSWLFGSGVVLAFFGGIYKLIIWLFKEYRLRKIRPNENFPFKVIPPNSNVAREILGGADEDPLADRNIPYQQRVQGRNTRRELVELIEDNRWILITGRTGLGKTREAVQLAQSLNNEGWTILYLTREAWLDAPAKLPTNVPERKLLFFLDDLNKKCLSSKAEIRPNASESLTLPIYEPFQTRLQRTLEAFDTFCGKSEIRVIATARNEKVSEFDEPSEWEKLGWTKYNDLWEKFKFTELLEPDKDVEQQLLTETAGKADISIRLSELPSLVERNDGTFRNLVENLSSARTEGIELSSENFRDTLKGTWQKRYLKATQTYSYSKYIYDAIELLRDINIPINSPNVLHVSENLSEQKIFRSMYKRRRLSFVLKQLIKTENILHPRDGQIEAKGYKLEASDSLDKLYARMVIEFFGEKSLMSKLIYSVSISLTPRSFFQTKRLSMLERIFGVLMPVGFILNDTGYVYNYFGFPTQALEILKKSLELKKWSVLNLFGSSLIHTSWLGLGDSYQKLQLYDEAINACKKAIQIKPRVATSWNFLGILYYTLNRYNEAIEAFQRSIELAPKSSLIWGNLGIAYLTNDDHDNALSAFKKSIEQNPKFSYSILSLALCKNSEREKLLDFVSAFIETEPEYCQACYYLAKNHIEKGLALLQKGISKDQASIEWAQRDPNFEIVRTNPHYRKIVGLD